MRYKSIILLFLAAFLVHIATAQEYPGIEKTAQFNLNLLSQTSLGGLAGGSSVLDNYLYVNVGLEGLKTFDVSDAANPVLTDFIPGWNDIITGSEIDRGYLFAPGDWNLTAYDLDDPAHPQLTAADFGWSNWGTSLFSSDNYIIKTFFNSIAPSEMVLVELYDAEDILNPQLVWEYISTSDAAYSVFDYERNILYTGGLTLIDFNDPILPVVVEYEDYGKPLSFDGDYLWCQIHIPLTDYYLVCYNRDDPYNLTVLDSVYMPLFIQSIYIHDDFAVLLDGNGNLLIFDISDRFNWVNTDSVDLINDLWFQKGVENLIYTTTNDSLFIFSVESGGGINESEVELSPIKNAFIDCFPNPFNQSTVIRYQLPSKSHVNLIIYDVMGREAAKLVDGYKPAGFHEVIFDAKDLSSGIYFVKLQAGENVITKKMGLVK